MLKLEEHGLILAIKFFKISFLSEHILWLYMGVSGNEEYPLVDCYITMEHHHFYGENSLFRLGHVQYVGHYHAGYHYSNWRRQVIWDLAGSGEKSQWFSPGKWQDFPGVTGIMGAEDSMSPWNKIHKRSMPTLLLRKSEINMVPSGWLLLQQATEHRWFPLNQSFATWWTDGWRRSPHMQTSDPVTRLDVYQPCLLEDRLKTAASVLLLLLQGGHVAEVWWAVHRIYCQISLYRDVYGLDYGGGHSL